MPQKKVRILTHGTPKTLMYHKIEGGYVHIEQPNTLMYLRKREDTNKTDIPKTRGTISTWNSQRL